MKPSNSPSPLAAAPALDISRKPQVVAPNQEFSSDPSMVQLCLGDVVLLSSRPHIVEHSSPSRARCLPLGGESVTVSAGGRTFTATKYTDAVSVSQCVPRELLLERAGEDMLKLFLAVKKGLHRQGNNETNPEKENEIMKTINSLPKGGLAAEAIRFKAGVGEKKEKTAKTKKETSDTGSKGKLGQLFGFSITAVLRKLGKLGFTTSQATKALAKQKVKPAEATVKIQLSRGRNGDGDLAELTKDQIEELTKDGGPAEKEKGETKKSKKPVSKKAGTESTTAPAAGSEPAAPTPTEG